MQLCLDGSKELVKKCTKETFYRNYIGFGINIAGKYLEIHGLIKEKGIKYHLPVIKAKIFLISKYILSYIIRVLLNLTAGDFHRT